MARRTTGFTLIELLVTIAIVGILAAVAMPVFSEQMAKSRRAEAISTLSDLMLRRMELGTAGRPVPELAEAVARVAAAELGWSDERRERELALLSSSYDWPCSFHRGRT